MLVVRAAEDSDSRGFGRGASAPACAQKALCGQGTSVKLLGKLFCMVARRSRKPVCTAGIRVFISWARFHCVVCKESVFAAPKVQKTSWPPSTQHLSKHRGTAFSIYIIAGSAPSLTNRILLCARKPQAPQALKPKTLHTKPLSP